VNLPSKKASFSVSVAAGMGLLLIGASGASADSFTVTGSDSDGPVSVDLGELWPSRLVATAEEDRLKRPAQFAHVVCGSQRLPNNRDL
jgi:hypothetical protein